MVVVVYQIISLGGVFDFVTFFHIPQELNKVVDGLAKWVSKWRGDWNVGDWGGLLENLSQELEEPVTKDMRCFLGDT